MRMTLTIDKGFSQWANAFGQLGDKADIALARALTHEGRKAKTQVIRALTAQTGLRSATVRRAVRESSAWAGDASKNYAGQRLTYELAVKGGNIRLKFFGARETRAGVSASPFGGRRLFPGLWIKGGRHPNRIALNMGGHVFGRTGSGRLPIQGGRSGLWLPDELIAKESAAAFDRVMGSSLADRISHELARMMP